MNYANHFFHQSKTGQEKLNKPTISNGFYQVIFGIFTIKQTYEEFLLFNIIEHFIC